MNGTDGRPGDDESPPLLAGEHVVFTGTLASMTHAEAAALVARRGGVAAEHVSARTTLLVVGEEGWPLEADGAASLNFLKARDLNRRHAASVRVLAESDWLRATGLEDRGGRGRLYTPAMLSQTLGVPVGRIRAWARAGLVRPVKTVHRLPYFDFAAAARTRTLADLLAAGVTRREIERGLAALRPILEDRDDAAAQLTLLAHGRRMLLRDAHGLRDPVGGQRVLDFDGRDGADDHPPALLRLRTDSATGPLDDADRTADEWFRVGGDRLDDGDAEGAVAAFREAAKRNATVPEVHFHLADALFRLNRHAAAAERYRVALELDGRYLEAWTGLGCTLADLGEHAAAADAFAAALAVHPDLPDAHFHRAESLHALGRDADAADHWRAYLEHDDRGPWADVARERLVSREPAPA